MEKVTPARARELAEIAEGLTVPQALLSLAGQLEAAQAELARPESSEMTLTRTALQMVTAERDKLAEQYNDLIYQVSQKFKDETRHQTAKRYIASWGGRSVETSAAKGAAHD